MAKLVSKIYGEALFEAAMEEGGPGRAAQLLEEIDALRGILAQNPGFDGLMRHPAIPKQEKIQVIKNVFGGRISRELENFLELAASKERYRELDAIFDCYTDLVKAQQKVGIAHVATAVELTQGQKNAVEAKLLETGGYQRMEMDYSVQPELIGGMVIRIGDRVVDSSIRTKLEGLTKQLLQIQLG